MLRIVEQWQPCDSGFSDDRDMTLLTAASKSDVHLFQIDDDALGLITKTDARGDRLNGSVARHEIAINQFALHDAKTDESSRINRKLVGAGAKVVWSIGGAVGAFVLTHLEKISKVFLP